MNILKCQGNNLNLTKYLENNFRNIWIVCLFHTVLTKVSKIVNINFNY